MIYSINTCEMLSSSIMRYNKYINITFKSTKKLSFNKNWQVQPNLAQDYETLHLMMGSKDFFVVDILAG